MSSHLGRLCSQPPAMAALGLCDEQLGLELMLGLQPLFEHVCFSQDSTALLGRLTDAVLGEGPPVDLIVASARLEPRNGLQLLADVRRSGWTVPFVLIADDHDELVSAAARDLGALVLQPPIDGERFKSVVHLMVRNIKPGEFRLQVSTERPEPGEDPVVEIPLDGLGPTNLDQPPFDAPGEETVRPSQWETAVEELATLRRDERRGCPRACLRTTAFALLKGRWRAFSSQDISPGGLAVHSFEALEEGALVSQMIIPAISGDVLCPLSEVVHVSERYGAFSSNVKFVELDDWARRRLDALMRSEGPGSK